MACEFDMSPPDITFDILTNNLYGLGLDPAKLDLPAFAATKEYCALNSLLISLVFDSQMSVLDALQHVISHHNGYISYFNGLIAHKQLQSESPISTITTEDTTKEDEYPVQINKKGGRDYNNKITVEYTKRDQEYVAGTAAVDDMVDIDKYGTKDVTVKLEGITKHPMASKMANLLLKKSLANPETVNFKLGPKSIGIKPGDVHAITDSGVGLSALPIRIETISEGDDYRIEVAATEELDVYDLITTGEDTTVPPSPPELNGDPGNVVNPLSLELPALYSQALCQAIVLYSKSANQAWAGASLYRAYSEVGSYGKLASKTGSGITGTVDSVGSINGVPYIDIVLDWDATLSSALSFNDLITTPGKNLLFIRTSGGDKFLKYQTADLIATKTWRLTGLIYDIVNVPQLNTYGITAITNKAGFYNNIPHTLLLNDTDKFRTLWFKLPSFNFGGLEQDLSLLAPISQVINALCDTPLQPYNIKINSIGVTEGGTIIIPAGDISISWKSRNRFNAGATNFNRTDTIIDDSDFQNFEIEIYNGATLLRTVPQTSKSYNYLTALQTTDGGPFNSYIVKIRQINTLVSSGQEIINITTV